MRTKLKATHAKSMNNGIIFYSKRHRGYAAISTIDDQGNIQTEWITVKDWKKNRSKQEKNNKLKKRILDIVISLPFEISVFIILYIMENIDPIYTIRTMCVGFALIIAFSFATSIIIEKKSKKNFFKFHSAEHMVLNAYSELNRVPTIEEIYKYSRFSNSCGNTVIAQIIVYLILMFVCTFIPNLFFRSIFTLCGFMVVYILSEYGFLNFLQNFTTIPPTEEELHVAISGMNVWVENESK